MEIRYTRLFDLLKQRNIPLKQVKDDIGFSNSVLDRLRHNTPVTTETIGKLCEYLLVTPNDIMEIIYDGSGSKEELARKRQIAELKAKLAELEK